MTGRDKAAAADLESEVRDVVQAVFVPHRRGLDSGTQAITELDPLVVRLAGASVEEIDRIIGQLQTMRDMLRAERDRVQGELMRYVDTNRPQLSSLKYVADDLAEHFRTVPSAGAREHIGDKAG
jgi:hypothetical protein